MDQSSPLPASLPPPKATPPLRLSSGWIFSILRGWFLSLMVCSARRGIGPEMSREDLHRSAADPGANCAIGPWIMAPGKVNPRLSCAPFLPSPAFPPPPFFFYSPIFILLFYSLGGSWRAERLRGGGRSNDVRCLPCRERYFCPQQDAGVGLVGARNSRKDHCGCDSGVGCSFFGIAGTGELLDGLEMRLCGCGGNSQQRPDVGHGASQPGQSGETPNFLPPRKKNPLR